MQMQAHIENEKITYENPLLSLNIFKSLRQKPSMGRWHYHKETEILTVHTGKLEVHIENETYTIGPGDSVLIGASQLHRDRMENVTEYTVLQFDIQQYFDRSTMPYIRMFTDSNTPLNRLNYILREDEHARSSIYRAVSDIYDEFHNKVKGYEIAITVLIKQILLALMRGDTRKVLNASPNPDIVRLKPVLDYIENHTDEKLSVQDAADLINMSYYYFVKYFKHVMGLSFTDYVNYKKIKRAEKILLTEKCSVSRVGEMIGMPNMAHFYKIFKRHNQCSPNEFRNKMTTWKN